MNNVKTPVAVDRRRASPTLAPPRKLGVSRKARNPRMTGLESCVLFILLVGLSAIVFVGVSGATRSGNVASCNANVSAVTSGLGALRAVDPNSLPTTRAGWEQALTTASEFGGSPPLSSWPKSTSYTIIVAGVGTPADSGDGVTPSDGDVLVKVTRNAKVYDATIHPTLGCAAL